ncbi:MAG: ATP-binding protein [Bacteroidales bacterium]|nr:ATP-binding protein [Bacteroidales bacterium]
MEQTTIHYIKEAARKLQNCQLQGNNYSEASQHLNKIADALNFQNTNEAAVFAITFTRMAEGAYTDMSDIAQHIGCSSMDILEYTAALSHLSKTGFIKAHGRRESNIIRQDFGIDDVVSSAIIENRPVEVKGNVANSSISKYDFCSVVGEDVEDSVISTETLINNASEMEKKCQHLLFINKLKSLVPDLEDRILYYDICYDAFSKYSGSKRSVTDISKTVTDIYTDYHKIVTVRRSLNEDSHPLMKAGLIERQDNEIVRLTHKGMELFFEEDLSAFCSSLKCKDVYEFVYNINEFVHDTNEFDCDDKEYRLFDFLEEIETTNTHLPTIANIQKTIKDIKDRVLFYIIASNTVDDIETNLSREVIVLWQRRRRKQILESFKNKKSALQKYGLVNIEKSTSLWGERTYVELSDKGKELVFGEDAVFYICDEVSKDLLQPEKINEKSLFFSSELESQLSLVRNSLMEDNYRNLCERLEEAHLPKGMNILLYGEPGTGKTESVLQMAKASGRAILHVDISDTKTCWFGESEKLIKKVFTNYKSLCEKSALKPILLFNEADAVFSKRKDSNSSNVAQTENAIQNIILEEMENMEGIMIATTNLADNLDGAFERRFLFKVHFDKPTTEAKKSIWQNKIPMLSDADALSLASQYDLSGGQIDNIVRKSLMQQIIAGEDPTLDSLTKLCNEERIHTKSNSKVGFGK